MLTGSHNAVYELLSRHLPVMIPVLTSEEVHDARFVVVHPSHVPPPPLIKVKVLHLLRLQTERKVCN